MERGIAYTAAVVAIVVALTVSLPSAPAGAADGTIVWERDDQTVEHDNPPSNQCLTSHWYPLPALKLANKTEEPVAVYRTGRCGGEPTAIVESGDEYSGSVGSLETMPTQG